MKKLFNLKTYLTLTDAAKYLSLFFGEEVKVEDILRLALDGHIILSVNFVNGTYARPGKIVQLKDAKHIYHPSLITNQIEKCLKGILIKEDSVLELGDEVFTIDGVWDLCMYGGESIYVERMYQQLTSQVNVNQTCLEGTFVQNYNATLGCLLKTPFNENRARALQSDGKPAGEAVRNFFPAPDFPGESTIVVRTQALRQFESKYCENTREEKPISTSERNTLLKLVIGMAISAYNYKPEVSKNTAPKEISDDLTILGMTVTDDTVRKYLKKAKNDVLPATRAKP